MDLIDIEDYVKINNNYKKFTYPDDVERIVKIMKSKGLKITPELANELWEEYSESYCAGWLILPSNEKVFDIIVEQAKKHFGVDNDD